MKLLVTALFCKIVSLISWSEMCFKNLALTHFFNCLLNFHLLFFGEDLVENLDEVFSSWGVSFFEDFDDEPLSISESFDDESSSLSLSDSSEDELYFLFLDPLSFFLGVFLFIFLATFSFHLNIVVTFAI